MAASCGCQVVSYGPHGRRVSVKLQGLEGFRAPRVCYPVMSHCAVCFFRPKVSQSLAGPAMAVVSNIPVLF